MIARQLNRYLQLEDCAKCLELFASWDDQGCNVYQMTDQFTKATPALIHLLTSQREGLHVSLGGACGPTGEGGACLMILKLLRETGLPNLVSLDLRRQCISLFDYLLLFRPRPNTQEETQLPCLQKLAVNVDLEAEGTAEHYPPLAEPKQMRCMKVILRGRYKYHQTDRFLETWDFTRKFTLAGVMQEDDDRFLKQYRMFSMPTVRTLSLAANVHNVLRYTFSAVYPNLQELCITDVRDATVPLIDEDYERPWLANVRISYSGKRKFRRLPEENICAHCGSAVAGERLRWNLGLAGGGGADMQAAYADQCLVLLSCTSMAIAEQRIDPLDVSLVYLQGRPAALDRERTSNKLSAAEMLIKSRHAEIRHLIFEACKEGAYEHENELVSELASFCREKFIPLLALCKANLTRLEVSAEFVFGCSLDQTAASQISALKGAFTKVRELSIEPDRHMEFERFKTQPVTAEKLIPFLDMFPGLTSLRLCAGKWVCWSNLGIVLAACSGLEKLYVSTDTVEDVSTALQSAATTQPHSRLRTLVFDFPEAAVPCDFSSLKQACQEVEYLLLRTNCTGQQTDATQWFQWLPRLRWLFCIQRGQNRTLVAHCAVPGTTTPQLRTLEYSEPGLLATAYPQFDSLFWLHIPNH
ncbi:unnamed protein product [Dibothriocephalus latus]|uniref:Uncharacterized protein n=1 Tax=Dibothriocephalus latus TaxID=60516 RepID=A0A3P7NPH5_DIBLA|nr:unnamed protein product [Dibothriocephalus latus]